MKRLMQHSCAAEAFAASKTGIIAGGTDLKVPVSPSCTACANVLLQPTLRSARSHSWACTLQGTTHLSQSSQCEYV